MLKIVHLCLASFFPDNYSYQENMLPKFHKKLGYEVEVIASTESFDINGNVCYLKTTGEYKNEYGIKVTRLSYKQENKVWRKLRRYKGTYEAVERANADVLFIHGCQFMDVDRVVKYIKKHPETVVYVDNHADFSNSATNWLSKNFLHKILWRTCAKRIEPYAKKFYGVLPARVDFLVDVYGLPKEKCELLVMGADDELVDAALDKKAEIRAKYNISEDDFLVMTGGKIDPFKTQTLLLMEAVHNIEQKNVKLIVFGSVAPELKTKVEQFADGEKVQYIGWVNANESYPLFAAADLVVFPGRHSVFWEQVVAQGIPLIVKYWAGTTHVDLGGNVSFLHEDSAEEIQKAIEALLAIEDYKIAFDAARKNREQFLYSNIAKKAVGQQ